jgi:hypothetical protein
MIHDLIIENYRSLNRVYLRDLTDVNILTGENGSGKSLVLKYILEHHSDSAIIRDGLGYIAEDHRSVILDKIPSIRLDQGEYDDLISFLPEIEDYYRSTGPERGGLDKIIKICKAIYKLAKEKNIVTFLIEEPETHLHPRLQKEIPNILDKMVKNLGVQFFVETHSPFIVSDSASLVDYHEKQSRSYHSNFRASQKVYFMKNGKLADKNGMSSIKGEYGYWGSKVNIIAAKMLGAGLMDLISPVEAELTHDAPLVVFCEGQGRDEDEKFYNIVFQNRVPRVLFVSSRGSSQLQSSFQLIREIRSGLASNFKLLMLRDRDHEFRDTQAIKDFERSRPGVHVLYRRAIECYIYNSEIAGLLYAKYNQELDHKLAIRLDELNHQIQSEAERGIKGDDYKERLKNCFYQVIEPLNLRSEFYDLLWQNLAILVTPQSKVYQELEQVVFD